MTIPGAEFQIRQAVLSDAAGIARAHVDAWRETYRGQIADEFLDGLSYARRQEPWEEILIPPERGDAVFVAIHGEKVIGFCSDGPERGSLPAYDGELYGIYLLQAYQGRGLGRALFLTAARHLHGSGFQSMMLWVLDTNPSRGFYEHMGGELAGEQLIEIGGLTYREVAYGWEDLAALMGV